MKKYFKELILVAAILALDQATKELIVRKFFPGETLVLLPVFQLTHVTNTGVAFGLFSGANLIFIFLTAAVIAGFAFWYVRNRGSLGPWLRWPVVVVIAGACGNLVDRIARGYVVDFLEAHWKGHYFPAFNVADSCISVGGTILFLWLVRSEIFRKNTSVNNNDKYQNPNDKI